MINALVVSGGGFSGLAIIKGLIKSEFIRTILIDCYEENTSRYFVDVFYQAPLIKDEDVFIDFLQDICEKESINIIFPSMEYELRLLSLQKRYFESKNIHVAVSSSALLGTLQDKRLLKQFLMDEGLPFIPEIDIDNVERLPVIGKPLSGFGGKGFIEIHHESDLINYSIDKLKKDYIFQPLLQNFLEYSIDFAVNSQTIASDPVIRRRNRTSGGFAIISESVFDEDLQNLANHLILKLVSRGAIGLFNFQILKTDDYVYISDINPRVGTSMVFTYGVAINLPLFFCSSIDGKFLKFGSSVHLNDRKSMIMVRYLEEMYYFREPAGNIKGVVFDLDDTLLDQKKWIMNKFEILWEKHSHILPPREDFLSLVLWMLEEGNRSKTIDAVCDYLSLEQSSRDIFIDTYRRIEPVDTCLYKDAELTLVELKTRGYKLALLTDNPPDSQKQKLRVSGLESLFDAVVFTRECGKEKPDKGAFLNIAGKMCIDAANLAMVGDNLFRDIAGAADAGFRLKYWIQRDGTFFNFSEQNYLKLGRPSYRKIGSLRELLWELT
ncbi:MAG: hypothetical protein CVV44_15120 [Spirochaetae bacterium HGW-Spirochaetae-1]|jgi:HAD superfamily hydrolase (TIGR01549 family)|nr:MAG: hypothetical protein CVV44_15120 [Spirochaetae bacterium HGW-Spirochaetae-1]